MKHIIINNNNLLKNIFIDKKQQLIKKINN